MSRNASGKPSAVALAVSLSLLGAVGCERDRLPDSLRQGIEVGALPEAVSAAAKKALPGVAFEDAWKNIERDTGKLHSYEIRGKSTNGKIREVRVSPTGEILETE